MKHENPSNLPVRSSATLHVLESARGEESFGPEGDRSDGSTTDFRRLRSTLWRFKWLIVTMPILTAIGGYGASRIIKPVYITRATVWINKQADPTAARTQGSGQFGSDAWLDLFRSYTVIDRVVSERHLSLALTPPVDSALVASFAGLEPRFTPGSFKLTVDASGKNFELATLKGVVIERRPVGSPVGASLGFKWTPPDSSLTPGRQISFVILSPRQAALGLLERLRVTIDNTGTFLHAELSGNDPATIAAVLNAVVRHFVEVATALKSEGLSDRTRILGDQLRSAQRDLASAESSLEQFRLQSIMRPNSRPTPARKAPAGEELADPAQAVYFTTKASMDAALRERTTIRRVMAEAGTSGLVVGELEELPSVKASSEFTGALKDLLAKRDTLRALSKKYTDSHPAVQKARSDIAALERIGIPEIANRTVAMLQAREADLAKSLASTEQDLKASPALQNTEARLQRAVTLAEGLYSQLQPRFEEAQLAEGSAVPDVRPLDPAEAPQFADKILTTRLILVAFIGGLGLACAAAIMFDRMDPKFRYPDQISREFGLTILGAVPHVSKKGKSGSVAEENSAFQEAIREIRMNVEYAYGTAGPLIFTVSSPGAADGKSFLSSNLARSFSESGRRTLLIDADLRRGELHRRCGVSRRPGLTDCLRGDVPLDHIIQHTKWTNLDIITSGTRKHDAPELLESSANAQLFGAFRERYDAIVVDSPPLSAGIDPFVLAALTGNLLLVVRTGVSVKEVIESKLKVLGRMPVRILGVVMNDVPRNSIYGYYSNYVPGYDTTDETGTALQRIIV
jgi:capsular exopolysaccharide synthesis family protein